MSVGLRRTGSDAPTSERWLQYYQEAKVRRRAHARRGHVVSSRRQWERRQLVLFLTAVSGTALLFAICLAILEH